MECRKFRHESCAAAVERGYQSWLQVIRLVLTLRHQFRFLYRQMIFHYQQFRFQYHQLILHYHQFRFQYQICIQFQYVGLR